MAFHGHTKIELHNVKTGENKVIEKHNIFTNYLHDVMQIVPRPTPTNWMGCGKGSQRYGATQWNNQNNANGGYPRIIDILCGGILCLANEHEENPDNYFLTGDDVITARGANIANASEDTQLGSYNVPLEKSSDTSKTMVWDFAQNQGNGAISTIGLTNIGMALCGLGGIPSKMTHTETNPFGDVHLAKDFIGMFTGTYDDDYPNTDASYFTPIYCSLKNQTLVSLLGFDNSKVLHLRYYDMNCNVINPMLPINRNANTSSEMLNRFGRGSTYRFSATKRVTFDLSSYTFAGRSCLNMGVTDDGIAYICPTSTTQWKPNTTMTFIKIDLMNQKVIGTYTVTNTSGLDLLTSNYPYVYKDTNDDSYDPPSHYCKVFDGYVIFKTYNSPYRTFAINLENSTDVKEILTEEGEAYDFGTRECNFAGRMLSSHGSTKPSYIIDIDKGVAYRVRTGTFTNEYFLIGGSYTNSSYLASIPSDSDLVNIWISPTNRSYFRSDSSYVYMSYKQDTLSTINVLDEPVIKTADMTMRITYTISLEEDEE